LPQKEGRALWSEYSVSAYCSKKDSSLAYQHGFQMFCILCA
jgi:hypothetical protein